MKTSNRVWGVHEKPKGKRPDPPPAPPKPGCFNPIITPAPPPIAAHPDILPALEKILRERGVDDFVPCKVLWGLLGFGPEAKR